MIFLLISLLASTAHAISYFDDIVVESSCTVPSLTQGDSSTKAANTSYVDTAVAAATIVDATTLVKGKIKLAGDLAGTADLPTVPALSLKAPLASPALTGAPTAPTQSPGDNSTKISTTAYTDAAVALATIPDATTLVKGKIQLAGDLAGTAALPTVPGLAGKEPSISAGTTGQYWRGDKTFQTLNSSSVGLGNVDNTSDASKPVSTATQTALNLKYDASNPSSYINSAGAPVQSVAGKTGVVTLVKGDVGLGNVDNTSDASKPISTATQTALDAKQALGNYITALTSDVSASGPGSVAATVNSVGGSTASAVNTGVVLANAATSANTVSTIVKRGSAGEFSAGVGTFTGLAVSSLPAQQMYVTKDNGNDANDCSLLKPCKTIQATITAANAIAAYYKPVIIHVAPSFGGTGSSYNENITFSQQGVNLICDVPQPAARACQISGTVTINMTGTSGGANFVAASNEAYMNGFVVGVNSAGSTVTFSGTTFQRFILINSYIDQNGAGNALLMSNSGTSGGSPSLFKVLDSDINNSNATAPAVDLQAGRFWLYGTTSTISNGNAAGPSVTQSGATSSMIANIVQITGQYNLTSNTATASFNLTTITSGTNPCIVTPSSANTGYALLSSFGCNSSNTNSITGTGVVANGPGNARFGSSGDIVSTVTQASIGPGLPQGELMLGPGATTGTNVLLSVRGGHIKAAQTTAPTATVNANAGTGATCTLSNASDVGGKINLTTTATAPASGTQCTITFNKAYGVAPICVFSSNNSNAALFAVANGEFITTTTTTLVVGYANADTLGHANNWMYHCMETQ